jgi:hypothetical protein
VFHINCASYGDIVNYNTSSQASFFYFFFVRRFRRRRAYAGEFPPEEMDPTALIENPQWRI